MKIIFASHNKYKTKEIAAIFQGVAEISSLADIDFSAEIEETGTTLQQNAIIKAESVYNATQLNCFADDTGLMVASLNGAPGVYSARYAGAQRSPVDNNNKLLAALAQTENRDAKFVTVICLIIKGEKVIFKGELTGKIAHQLSGANGFGYDPLFIPDGYEITLAEMSLEQKNLISHRAKAFNAMLDYLKQNLPAIS